MHNQRCFISANSNPFFNLAAEEYLLKNTDDELFILYINGPSVVVGKHQNLLKEINAKWCYKHNIKITRRLSGGGTVYQDNGNINFSFINNCSHPENLNYKKFTYPIFKSLLSMDLDVQYSERNDILLKGLKISGNSMHISKGRVLCHGTLLFDSDLKNLSSSLKNNAERYIDKSIKSVPSGVVNISEHLSEKMNIDSFVEKLFLSVIESTNATEENKLKSFEIDAINKLADEKYSSMEWIYGYSPKYQFRNRLVQNDKIIEFALDVEKGIIKSIDSDDNLVRELLNKYLVNVRHDYYSLKQLSSYYEFNQYFKNYNTIEDFCDLFF